jgi:hypothetical protein
MPAPGFAGGWPISEADETGGEIAWLHGRSRGVPISRKARLLSDAAACHDMSIFDRLRFRTRQ